MRPATERVAVLLTLGCLWPALAQGQELELRLGRWIGDNDARTYELRTGGHLVGPLSHGATLLATVNEALGRGRAFYGVGYDLMVLRPTRGLGAYGILGVALGLSTDTTHKLGAQWSVGAGLEWRPFGFAVLGTEARYRVEDRGPRGFWAPTDSRTGFSWSLGLGIRWAGKGSAARDAVRPAAPVRAPATLTGSAAGVVQIALDALGAPYRWGGTAENGFDCSGLVQWAYAQHGVQLPRRSREQAMTGLAVTPVVDALVPGDILLFAARPGGGVTHVGLYAGERKFIHSSSSGVQLSLLDHADVSGSYWLTRWVGARRVIP